MNRLPSLALLGLLCTCGPAVAEPVRFTARTAQSGPWSEAATWENNQVPRAGDYVQIRSGHVVTYDVHSDQALRLLHVAGRLTFARDRATRLDVGLIKVQPGEEASEDGFLCDHCPVDPRMPMPALEIGTADNPLPANVTATIRLTFFEGTDRESLPGILVCRGRWDVHGAPLSRTWVKLGATAHPGADLVTLSEPVIGWKTGDRIILTGAKTTRGYNGTLRGSNASDTEVRTITRIEGTTLTLNQPLGKEHLGNGAYRNEVANLSRNVVVESAQPDGVRGHTMYHRNSAGGISHAEFRHLGKEGVLGKYAIHFHLVRDSMRGSGVVGASIWDSHNRWLTIHGTDHLLVRDCVGYQSVGHGFFLEDATEQYNVLDRNLAVQAYAGKPLPKQVLPFDKNEGAGFWWANGRNTFTRNVSCENDHYGYLFEVARKDGFDPVLPLQMPDGTTERRDVRTLPFFRFEDNEAHTLGFYGFKFGDHNTGIQGDRHHPFIVRNLKTWRTHYEIRPDLAYFLVDGLHMSEGNYGIYQADYDYHVYRNLYFRAGQGGINRAGKAGGGNGRSISIQPGPYTVENVTFDNYGRSKDGRLIVLHATSPQEGQYAHFRNIVVKDSEAVMVDDTVPGPGRNLLHGITYYFHDPLQKGQATKVVSVKYPELMTDGDYQSLEGFTGTNARAIQVKNVEFPALLDPVDDLPPASLITSVRLSGGKIHVRGVSHDNGVLDSVTVNGAKAAILSAVAGVVDWEITLDRPGNGRLEARSRDKDGNVEKVTHVWKLP
jgi:hypothetical protein